MAQVLSPLIKACVCIEEPLVLVYLKGAGVQGFSLYKKLTDHPYPPLKHRTHNKTNVGQ